MPYSEARWDFVQANERTPTNAKESAAARCTCGDGSAEEDRGAVLRCPVHGIGADAPSNHEAGL